MADLLKSGDTVVDIGANRGMFALAASSLVGKAGKVICFEPNPNCAKVLEREIASNSIKNIVIYQVGLGSLEAVLILSVPTVNWGEGTFGTPAYCDEMTYQVSVPVKRGDQMLAQERPSLIKIDVESFECNVIAGLAGTIARHRPIIATEVVPAHLSRCGSSVAELKGLMEELEYRGFTIDLAKERGRYNWRLHPFRMHEKESCDVLWVPRQTECLR